MHFLIFYFLFRRLSELKIIRLLSYIDALCVGSDNAQRVYHETILRIGENRIKDEEEENVKIGGKNNENHQDDGNNDEDDDEMYRQQYDGENDDEENGDGKEVEKEEVEGAESESVVSSYFSSINLKDKKRTSVRTPRTL